VEEGGGEVWGGARVWLAQVACAGSDAGERVLFILSDVCIEKRKIKSPFFRYKANINGGFIEFHAH
jgi:hypothetical protein